MLRKGGVQGKWFPQLIHTIYKTLFLMPLSVQLMKPSDENDVSVPSPEATTFVVECVGVLIANLISG